MAAPTLQEAGRPAEVRDEDRLGCSDVDVGLVGCQGAVTSTGQSGSDPTGPIFPFAECPMDPDCASTPAGCDPYLRECRDYFLCRPKVDGFGERCENPGPDYPDGSQKWDCQDSEGRTECSGGDFPDEGGDGGWTCESAGEFVVCSKDNPDFPSPDTGGSGPWTCWYSGEFRICESGEAPPDSPDDGGYTCFVREGMWNCTDTTPSFPDDGHWNCYFADAADETGDVICTRQGDLPDDGGSGGWDCTSAGEFVECTHETPDYPDAGDVPEGGGGGDGGDFTDGGGDGGWNCEYTSDEFVVCEEAPPDGGGQSGRQRRREAGHADGPGRAAHRPRTASRRSGRRARPQCRRRRRRRPRPSGAEPRRPESGRRASRSLLRRGPAAPRGRQIGRAHV